MPQQSKYKLVSKNDANESLEEVMKRAALEWAEFLYDEYQEYKHRPVA